MEKDIFIYKFRKSPLSIFVPVFLAITGFLLLFGVNLLHAQTPLTGLTAAYALNEGSGSIATDASGNLNTGTISGATWTTSGRYNSALSFDGSNDRVNINDANSLDLTNGMTLEAWVYPTISTRWRTVIMKERSGGLTYALYANNNASRPAVYVRIGNTDRSVTGTAALPLNTWSHLAATYNGATLWLYVNGNQVGSLVVTGAITVSNRPLRIGGSTTLSNRYFNGRIDEVRIYNRALTQAEIQYDMNTAIPSDTAPPTSPSNLIASAASSSQINLTWTASTDDVGVTGYHIERCQGLECTNFAEIVTTTGTSYNNTGLRDATSYSYRVRATDAAGNFSSYSITASATTPDTTPPTAPTNLAASAASESQINLAWSASTDNVGVTGYQVERCQGAGCSSFALVTTVTGTTYNNTGLLAGTSYSYRVRATDAAANLSLYSSTASTKTLDTTPPTAPTNLAASAASESQISLAWTASTDNVGVTGYQIERCQGAGCSNFALVTTVTGTTYNNTGLLAGTSYSYRVRATDAAGNFSPYSDTASATTPDTTPPTAPTNLAASAASESQINLAWTASTDNVGVTGYQIERCQGAGCSNFALMTTVTGTTYSNTGLLVSTTYNYRVRATDAAGNLGNFSNTATATTPDMTPPTAPSNLTASAASESQINLAWTASADNVGVTGYQVERCQGAGCSSFALVTTVTGTTYNNTGLPAGTSYSYRVRATDGAGNLSTYSNTASATTLQDATPPTAPSNLTASATGSTQINLAWTASTDNVGVTGYQVERCQGAGCSSFALVTTVTGTTYDDTGLLASTSYSYRVQAKDATGNLSPYSNTASATTQNSSPCTSLVIVNQLSPDYANFQELIKPHLDNVGIPYSVVDIATTPVSADIGNCAVILIGHRQLDVGAVKYLDATEQGYISTAVNTGTGLVNFDNVLDNAGTPRYNYVQTIFNFGYGGIKSGSGVTFSNPSGHYITEKHSSGETISTETITLAGITLPSGITSLVTSGSQPFLAVTTYGTGHAVQWGSYDWMSHSVKGPLFGFDDLVWRSIVWAARKPFVMQGLPPFVTMRMDDTIGPLWWIHTANEFGFIPWAGIFTDDIDSSEAADLSNLVNTGKATVAMHAFGTSNFFYFDHNNERDFSDSTMASHYAEATTWFNNNNIPISKYVVPHYYEIGTNAFNGLENWGVEFIGTMMDPGEPEATAPWIMNGPFRLYETGYGNPMNYNPYYTDYMTIPGHPELNWRFFNCVTEIRDITGYEWLGNGRTSVAVAVQDGTEWLKRAFDSMDLATLFSHEYTFMGLISQADWRAILQGITQTISVYDPIYVSLDYACQYVRAMYTSNITAYAYDPVTEQITTTFGGNTDMPTKFYLFTEISGNIQQTLVDVPQFSGSTQVVYNYTPPPPDTTPPTVSSVSPSSGASDVNTWVSVTAIFSEAMDPATINTSTFELRDPLNNIVPSSVTYSISTKTATLQSLGLLANSTTYTATLQGGSSGVKDSSGNPMAIDFSWSFTTSSETSLTIWGDGAIPQYDALSDGQPIELGLKFRSDIDGYITGLRFYKGLANTGTHIGNLWDMSGNLLASETFTNETASGWQEVSFVTPVPITANTTYVASYYSPSGYFAVDEGYFASAGVDNGPLHALADGVDGPNGVYKYGSGFPTSSYDSSNYWVDILYNTTVGPDTTPPTVSSVSPSSGASDVSTVVNVSATFSEAVDPATINASTFELRDPSNVLVASVVTYDTATRIATLDPSSSLAISTTYTATVKGGTDGVKDIAGNPLTNNFTWSFTTGTSQALPGVVASYGFDEGTGLFVGDSSGNANIGIISGAVWTASGWFGSALTFDGANDRVDISDAASLDLTTGMTLEAWIYPTGLSDWRTVILKETSNGLAYALYANDDESRPALWVNIGGNDFYVQGNASLPLNTWTHLAGTYNGSMLRLFVNGTQVGVLAADGSISVSSNPLRVGGNAVWGEYFSGRIDEVRIYNRALNQNEIQSDTSTPIGPPPPDTIPPMVSNVSPSNGSYGVGTGANVTATFSEAVDPATINTSDFELRDPSNSLIPSQVNYNITMRIATLDPSTFLANSTTYNATVKGGSGGVKDIAGNPLTSDITWSFTTAAPPPPPPDEGPGGPILVVAASPNPFSRYYAEILRAEGFNAFTVSDISLISAQTLSGYDVVILGEVPLTSGQVTMLSNWVYAGGNLIAMRPDKKLASLLGLTDSVSTLSDAYLLAETADGPGKGIVNQTVQFHGIADLYGTSDATTVATLYSSANDPTQSPAVTLRNVGTNGGQAAAFTYDLARSVVYTRQGNPLWAGQERDGETPIRSNDLFYPDWIDLNKVAIPQADEQQRLLANLIIQMNFDKEPLPRFWYFPDSFPAVVIMTGDDHGGGGTVGRFDDYIASSPPNCSVENWECIRSTSYIEFGALTNDEAATYTAAGFEIGAHIDTGCADWTPSSLEGFFADDLGEFQTNYPSLPSSTTNRTHCIVWSDYDTQPQVELAYGIRLDTNYYYYPPSWILDRPGFFTGSGMPMRFTKSDGTMIDVYQAATQMTDESGQTYPYTVDELLDKAIGPEGYYGAFTANMHNDSAYSSGSDAIIASALARQIPVVSARQMLEWLDGRNGSSFSAITWVGNSLSFAISVGENGNGLMAMVPTPSGLTVNSITHNGSPILYSMDTIKGIQYAFFYGASGSYEVTFIPDSPPTVTGVFPPNGASGINRGVNITATFSKEMDATTITTNTFELRDSSNTIVPAGVTYDVGTKIATLDPTIQLMPETTYTAIVKGGAGGVKDINGTPMSEDVVWTFTTSQAQSYTIWPAGTVPEQYDAVSDGLPIEVGVKFRTDIDGYITGLRFYKGLANTGTHIGNLWDMNSNLLASVTFTNETASGWQEVLFQTPVLVTASTTYVASYYSPSGYYAFDGGYFVAGVDNVPLHALANGVDGSNGVYVYGGGFPTSTYNSSNYWVDVVFQP